jgi:hypothetical protein
LEPRYLEISSLELFLIWSGACRRAAMFMHRVITRAIAGKRLPETETAEPSSSPTEGAFAIGAKDADHDFRSV